ncbi:MAG: gamma-glutamylcyclotransferase family protein [Pseudomonadota bacterium]
MTTRLFVYGTLAPGRPNEHVLAPLTGTWQPAVVRGTLLAEGWGAAAGYPGIVLDERGDDVAGFVFSSDDLPEHWQRLDDFEGEGYQRVLVNVALESGATVAAYIYALSKSGVPPDTNLLS